MTHSSITTRSMIHPIAPLPLGGRVAFFGRTLRDYAEIFGLDPARLPGRRVLDVAAGPSSFTLEATLAGAEAVAVDPLYRLTAYGLADRFERDFLAAHEERYVREAAREAQFTRRRFAAKQFLGDFVAGLAAGRYRAESLPMLSFDSDQFDEVLCGHFLFLYAHRQGEAFHFAACVELCRVAREKVCVYPLYGFDSVRISFLERLRRDLGAEGIESALESLPSPMFDYANERMILYPKQR